MKTVLSPRELSEALGVSESSLKRWVDRGEIRASKTAGGHRRIPVTEAIRFIRSSRAPLVRPELLGLADLVSPAGAAAEDAKEGLFLLLREGRVRESRGLVLSMYLEGLSVAEICDGPIRDAMSRIGELWQHDAAGIYVEHRATDICLQALTQLRLMFETPAQAPVALGGAPSTDPYLLPSLMAATTLAGEGFRAMNLGPDTPMEAMHAAVEEHRPELVWISLSAMRLSVAVMNDVTDFASRMIESGVNIVIGGRTRIPPEFRFPEGVYLASTMGELAAFARGLVRAAEQPSKAAVKDSSSQ